MLKGMLEAARGCVKEELRMDVISNNLANSTVIGFKKDVISFQDLLEQAGGGTGSIVSGEATIREALVRVKTDLSQGDLRFTNNPLDFAVFGEGFFKVMTPEGVRYTRKGDFRLDENRFLVTQQGYKVLGEGGPIEVPDGDFSVDGQGVIKLNGSEQGRIALARFEGPSALIKEGLGLYRKTDKAVELPPPPETQVRQGYLELSNVNVAKEMVNMIHCLRAFESYQKAIQVLDGINNRVINEVSRVR
ncbi:MAG: flagellar basal-body rod protein FlgF [Deltaproteobacteria bacterium]|nr:flagellar basal-body rod protein FlgF [Deltaproteobacteria bacterium]MBW2015435.1 flagellar basal-body rod protein FlgF [Deltaproteobacteria bacterium]MBW2129189.1 flagellar basal-body rod protein FlgF [Deltaproteobacteria bacterium]MBW2302803.1 flagellar basal-body rod protein FlgF [Deltaproteobacteria bacterium]